MNVRPFTTRIAATSLAFVMLIGISVAPAKAEPPPYKTDAKSALLIDNASGDVLFSQNPDAVYSPASLTKLMTLRLAYKALHDGRIHMTDKVPINVDSWAQNPAFKDASLMFLKPGDDVTVEQILKGIAVPSGNDASVAIADFLAGTVSAFVQQMNDEALKLGMTHTHFVDPDGLSADNQTTARDLAILSRAYIADAPEALTQLHSLQAFSYAGISQANTDELVGVYQGLDGLKTGYLPEVGYNQISTAKRGDFRLIGILIGTKTAAARRDQSAALLDYGFQNFTSITAMKASDSQGSVRVWFGKDDTVNAVPATDVALALQKGTETKLQHTVSLTASLSAPITKGQKLGTITFTLGGKSIRTVDLVAANDVPQGGFFKRTMDHIKLFFAGLFHRKK